MDECAFMLGYDPGMDTTLPLASASLPVRFVLYLPSMPDDSHLELKGIEDAVVKILCERFGGVTAYPAKGTFTMASGIAHTEAVTVLESYCEREAWRVSRAGLAAMAGLLAGLLGQEAIGCSVDGKMILIKAKEGHAPDAGQGRDLSALLREAFS